MTSPPRLYPTDLTDAEWHILEPLVPAAKPVAHPPKWTRRAICNGILYIVRAGCHWRLLPREFPRYIQCCERGRMGPVREYCVQQGQDRVAIPRSGPRH